MNRCNARFVVQRIPECWTPVRQKIKSGGEESVPLVVSGSRPYEIVERPLLMVQKRDGSFEPFDRQKLITGIF